MSFLAEWRSRIGRHLKRSCAKHDLVLAPYRFGDRRSRLQEVLRIDRTRQLLLDPGEACQLISALQATERIEGDVAEVGVAYGASARLMAGHLGDRTIHLFDTFEGLPQPGGQDSAKFEKGDFRCGLESVREYLQGLPVVFHKGWFPDSAATAQDRRFSFVHLDVDLYQSTLDGLK